MNPILRSMIGEVVEIFVKYDYCKTKGGCHEFLHYPGGPQTDFFDVSMGFHRCAHLAAYLKLHNPHVSQSEIVAECTAKKQSIFSFPVPDIITHEPPSRLEFYEVKPDSPSGRQAADKKVDWFLAISDPAVFKLPYRAGTTYAPNGEFLLWSCSLTASSGGRTHPLRNRVSSQGSL